MDIGLNGSALQPTGFAGNLGGRKLVINFSLLFFSYGLDRFITRLAGYAKSAASLSDNSRTAPSPAVGRNLTSYHEANIF